MFLLTAAAGRRDRLRNSHPPPDCFTQSLNVLGGYYIIIININYGGSVC